YEWDFGDGETSTVQNPSHTYAAEGEYDVSLTVTGPDDEDTKTMTGYIEVADIVAEFSAEPTEGDVSVAVSLPVQFTDVSVGDIASWEWDLDGDGLTDSTEQSPSYTYETAGAYDVSLRVEGPDGTNTETKAAYITASAYEWPEMDLRLSHGMSVQQVGAKTAQKFADLLEEYTDGAMTVTVYPSGTLLQYQEEFEAVRAGGTVDITWTSPFFLRSQDPNLDFVGALPNAYSNLAHTRAVVADGRLTDYTTDRLEDEYGIHLIGLFEIIHMGGYFTNARPLEEVADLSGLNQGLFRSGSVNPYEEFLGMTGQYTPYVDLVTRILDGTIDTITNSVDAHVSQGFVNYLPYAWCVVSGSYTTPLFNLAKWDSLGEHVQALINDVITPECQELGTQLAVEDEKKWYLIASQEMDSIVVAPPDHTAITWEGMQSLDSMQDLLDDMDPLILDVIEELRPPAPTAYDADIQAVIEFAGLGTAS
ncbi:TRAP transporter substrate-binding protein DctP, partial [Chloroflexota bacterium]